MKRRLKNQASEPTVLIFSTGGTIGMRSTNRGLAPDPDFPEALEHFVQAICEPLGVRYRINHLNPPIDSANADADTAPRIARNIGARARTVALSGGLQGVVILHGTDTLAFTASRLAFELGDLDAPVIVTGSQHPLTATGSDATANLSLAIKAACKARPDAPVCVAFGGELLPAVRASKVQAEANRAFRAPRELADGAVGVRALAEIGGSAETTNIPTSSARVVSFRFVPGVVAEDLRAVASAAPDGLVLECYGSGNGPTGRPDVADALRDLCAQLPVVAVTQCETGGVDFDRYEVAEALAAAGVIDGGDMTLEAALGKLAFCLDRGLTGEGLRRAMMLNLVGERVEGDVGGGS